MPAADEPAAGRRCGRSHHRKGMAEAAPVEAVEAQAVAVAAAAEAGAAGADCSRC